MGRRATAGGLTLLALAASAVAGLEALEAPKGAWRFEKGTTAIAREAAVGESWTGRARLTCRASLSDRTIHTVHLAAYLVTGDKLWYQTARTVDLSTTRVTAVAFDLTPNSGDWVPRGHMRPWDAEATRHVQTVGLKAFCNGRFEGSVIVERVAVDGEAAEPPSRLRLVDFEAPRRCRAGERVEIRFRLPRRFDNPFDVGAVRVEGLIEPPGDGSGYRLVPGFYTQRHVRRWEGGGEGRLAPAGPPHWCIRFWPRQPGVYRCRIVVRTPDAEARVPWSFEAAPAVKAEEPASGSWHPAPGDFVIERRYNGRDAIYIHRPGGWRADARVPAAGLIHAWRAPIEWTSAWGGYAGLGRVNLAVASAFDELLDEAAAHGVRLPLALTCSEPFGERAKYNWKDNPLNKANGGPLEAPSRFYSDEAAWEHFVSMSRYILARWGGHPAVSSWELWSTMPANGADRWHARAGEHLSTWRLGPKDVRSHHPQTLPPASFAQLNTFRQQEMQSRERWTAHTVIRHSTESLRIVAHHATDGDEALEVTARYPGEAAILREVEADWHRYDRLAFDIFVPANAPNDMRVMVYLRDGDLWWYETLLPTFLRPGDWTKLLVDLSGEITAWEPQGHAKVFDRYVLQRVRVLGIRVFGHRPYHGPLYLDNLQLWKDPSRQRAKRVKVTFVEPSAVAVPQHGLFELTFRLSEVFANPFDPEVADVVGHFTTPGGRTVRIPAFFSQDYERHLVDGREMLTPKGQPCWKLRFTPTEADADAKKSVYTYSVTVNGQELPAISGRQFVAVPSGKPGFVRRSKRDPRYFELSTGQFFYPIGMNLRSPSDNRKPYAIDYPLPEGKGTYIYDEYFKRLAEAEMNWARIWQCPWWCGLEWTRKWPGYQGLGRYNLENAWRFDYLLEQAAARGIYVQACLTNHGQIVIDKRIDRQWDDNPLNSACGEGGPISDASDFYTNDRARKLFRQRLRYTVARWGYSPHLMAFALFSEMEFTKAYWNDAGAAGNLQGTTTCPPVSRWVGEMAAYIKRTDPFGHLVTTHFSHPWRGADVWQREELDFVQSNAYSGFSVWKGLRNSEMFSPVTRGIDYYYDGLMKRFGRPVLIAEYGGHWMRNPRVVLDAELHCGTWASITNHLAGCTGYWWWLHVHFKDRYPHYRAAARYMAGEDRRGQDLRTATPPVHSPQGYLRARALRSDRVAYVWVYNPRIVRDLDAASPVEGARLDLPDLAPGRYRIEFWNTFTGEVVARRDLATDGATLRIELPTVDKDIALKIKPAG